jgi:hypothetical protein
MRRLVLCIIILIAIFAVVRAYTQGASAGSGTRGIELAPGLVEVTGSQGALSLAFGLMGGGDEGRWNVLPLRIVYSSGDKSVSLALNGLTFLLAGGVRIGRPLSIDRPTRGDVVSIGGKVTVSSSVDGDVWVFGSDITLGAGALVTGNVVCIGGRVMADPRARVAGALQSLPELKLPYLSILATQASAPTVELIRELLGFLLAALVLFLSAYFLSPHLAAISRTVAAEWRRSLLTLVLSLLALPVLVLLLVISIFGIFFLPFLLLAVMIAAFAGFFGIAIRFGSWLRRASQDSSMFLFTSGILGLFLIRLPAFAGIVLSLVRSPTAAQIGQIMRIVSLGLGLAFLVYGLGCSLAYLRILTSARKA